MMWSPPRKPDPSAIFSEAKADARDGRYREALDKHLWFHRYALKYQRSLYGVRLSYALNSWLKLGGKYRPALRAFKMVRGQAEARLRARKGSQGDFYDFSAFSEYLGEQRATARLFVWLDRHRPSMAKRVYSVAQNALVHTRRYRLCGKYINTDESIAYALRLYGLHKKMAKDPRLGSDVLDHGKKTFSHQTTTLVALLVRNGRAREADQAVAAAAKARPGRTFRRKLNEARKGKVPVPWP